MQPILTECTTLWLSWFTVEGNRAVGHAGKMLGGGQCTHRILVSHLDAGLSEVSLALGALGRK